MQTVRQEMQNRLTKNGMFEEQAKKVMDVAVTNLETMDGRWNDAADGYNHVILNLCWIHTKKEALKWIDANIPEAWFRDMFIN